MKKAEYESAHLVMDEMESLLVDLVIAHPRSDDIDENAELVVVTVEAEEDPVGLLIERETHAGEFGIICIFLERVAHELGKETGLNRREGGGVDDGPVGEVDSHQRLGVERTTRCTPTHDRKRKKTPARGIHHRSSFLCHTREIGLLRKLRGLRAGCRNTH